MGNARRIAPGDPGFLLPALRAVSLPRADEGSTGSAPAPRPGDLPLPVIPESVFAELDLIRKCAALLGRRVGPEIGAFADDIRRNARRLESVCRTIRTCRELVRAGPSDGGSVELHDVAEYVISRFRPEAARARLRLLYRGSAEAAWTKAGEEPVRDALVALVANAIRFTPSGTVTVGVETDGDRVRLVVEDTGPGVTPEDLPALEAPFRRGQAGDPGRGGLGLGLTLARAVADRFDGRLTVERGTKGGSRFVLEFAQAEAPAESAGRRAA